LWFRDLKTSMGMEVLRCRSPTMVHKELEMFFIAYNLIRLLKVEAGAIYQMPLQRLSFKGTVDALRQFSTALAQARSAKQRKELTTRLLQVIARDLLPGTSGPPRTARLSTAPHLTICSTVHAVK
jgi:hypothetical protein